MKVFQQEYFEYLHLRFNLTKARELAKHYTPDLWEPKLHWISPLTNFNKEIVITDYTLPVLFATIILEDKEGNPKIYRVLIEGSDRVYQAVKKGIREMPVIVLGLADTLKILTTLPKVSRKIRRQGKELGLL